MVLYHKIHRTPPCLNVFTRMQDPVNIINNVGRNSYNVGQVQKCLFEALTTLKATMVRVNQDGKEASYFADNLTPKCKCLWQIWTLLVPMQVYPRMSPAFEVPMRDLTCLLSCHTPQVGAPLT